MPCYNISSITVGGVPENFIDLPGKKESRVVPFETTLSTYGNPNHNHKVIVRHLGDKN